MGHADLYTARFDVVGESARKRFTVGEEHRDREANGAIPTEAWFHGEEYRFDVEDGDGVAICVRRLETVRRGRDEPRSPVPRSPA
ncbi:hypothetical protein [Microbacterium sp. CPCC 204701]|uniref:hypothetical protein n=1 Tax=Microbacterium sp. CPCC 204701 TaxID=2493084 RepID=UPI000FDA2DE8|nr:hypothetical protein [Microbacterium sp. CPCC 204701]